MTSFCSIYIEWEIRSHATTNFSAALDVRLVVRIFRQFVSHRLFPACCSWADYSKRTNLDLACSLSFCHSLCFSLHVTVYVHSTAENFEFVGPQRAHACEVVYSTIQLLFIYKWTDNINTSVAE